MRMAKETARSIYAEAAREPHEARRKALVAFAGRSENEPSLRRLLILAQSEPGIPVTPDQLDADPFVLNTPTGTLELRTLHLRPHRRADLITKVTAASYVAGATHPVFDAYRARMLGDGLDDFLARAAGYTLTGSTSEEKLFFCHGVTASGKTTLTKAMASALGDYAMTADFASFLEGRNGDGPRNDLARLAGARMVVSVEVQDGSRLAEGLLKLITGGDRVTARFLYGEHFEFVPAFKLWLVANDRPRARDTDEALWRRLLEIPFAERLGESERDPAVKATLCDPAQAGPAVLAWAADGAAAWFASGLGVPDVVRRATEGYRASMDPLADFLADCCELHPDAAVTAKRLREAYETWARENGSRPVSGRTLVQRLEGRGCERLRRHGGERWWIGIRLRGDTTAAEEQSPW
jgi:putative DNA primase/helicase